MIDAKEDKDGESSDEVKNEESAFDLLKTGRGDEWRQPQLPLCKPELHRLPMEMFAMIYKVRDVEICCSIAKTEAYLSKKDFQTQLNIYFAG